MPPSKDILSNARRIAVLVLVAVLGVCLTLGWKTRGPLAHIADSGPADTRTGPVDLAPSRTAQSLAALAVTAEEADYARDAQRLADHEVDQAFAAALRKASVKHRNLKGEALALSQKVSGLQATVKEEQAHIQALTASPSNNPDDDLEIAKAQLGLDTDQLADAQQDLARAVGDDRPQIQQELTAHQVAMREYETRIAKSNPMAIVAARRFGTLAGRIAAWFDQRTRYQLLLQAAQQSQTGANELTTEHRTMEGQMTAIVPGLATDKATMLSMLKNGSAQRQTLTIYDDRIDTLRQLAAIYTKWSSQVLVQHRTVLHLILQSVALIAFILICVILLNALVRRLVNQPTLDQRRMQTLRTIFELAVQFTGALLILFVIFGTPSELTTLLGLATAGLTVVMQDFIIAFFGWFVLMGKSGMRVGDWVEINGVGGEVVEIGLFRTAMLETGNWTDRGHPTGRRITFINSFAIRGQYFNFSTAGQWMWDEIKVTVPTADGAYETIEQIHKAVLEETEKDAALAEEEWNRAKRVGLTQFAAAPSVDLRPVASGIDVSVRYVTRATERLEVRNRLYQCVIDLMHKQQKEMVSAVGIEPTT